MERGRGRGGFGDRGRGGFGDRGGRGGGDRGRGRGGRGFRRGRRGRRGRRRRRRGGDKEVWVPVTKLGRLVKAGHIKSLEEIYQFSLPIKEYQIVEHFLGESVLKFAGIADCYTSSVGQTRCLGNFVKATYHAINKTYSYLTPDLWAPTKFSKSPFQEYTDFLKESKNAKKTSPRSS